MHHPEEGGRLFFRRTKQVRVWPPSTARTTCMYERHVKYCDATVGWSRQRYPIIIVAGAPIQEAASEGHTATCSHLLEEGTKGRPPLQSIGHWRPHCDLLHPPEEGGRLFCRRTKQVRVWPPSTARTTCMYVCMYARHAAISARFFCRTEQAAILYHHSRRTNTGGCLRRPYRDMLPSFWRRNKARSKNHFGSICIYVSTSTVHVCIYGTLMNESTNY